MTFAKVNKLNFYLTPPGRCNYLPNCQSTTLFADPFASMSTQLYSGLAQRGFRRSGEHVYLPHCKPCSACIPVRIPVIGFAPNRSQRRTWKINQDISVTPVEAKFNEEHFQLYQRYLSHRHKDGGMDNPDQDRYMAFLTSTWSDTCFYEFRLFRQLLAIAVIDRLQHGLSAVYSFFDPNLGKRGLGVYTILWGIQETQALGLPWLFLGYWIKDCKKMGYKINFRPLEILSGEGWKKIACKDSIIPYQT